MVSIRAAEEKIGDMVASGRIRCPCHLAIGQEAAAVGVATQLRNTDRVFGAHRSHGHYLALGGSLHGLMAEVQGKETGASRGMGGSMHLIDLDHGLYGTVPIVGATIPIAVGAGLAAKMDGKGDIAVSFFGDGATEEGVFHESMNLAVNLNAPVLFVCENNLFSSHLHIRLRQPKHSVCRYAEAHQVPWERVDGNDVVEIARATRHAVSAMRDGGGPRFLELVTYRWRGHVGPREDEDVGVQRKDDLTRWKRRDPIRRLADALVTAGILEQGGLSRVTGEAKNAVEEAWGQATRDPFPPTEALLDRVYTKGPGQ
jgi:pyruvate dehydrogenase E1 component alpha subunit